MALRRQRVLKEYRDVKVIVLTSFSDQAHVLPALRAGASGYILKDVEPDQLVEAIRSAYKGNIQLHPDIANALLSNITCRRKGRRALYSSRCADSERK